MNTKNPFKKKILAGYDYRLEQEVWVYATVQYLEGRWVDAQGNPTATPDVQDRKGLWGAYADPSWRGVMLSG